MRAISVNATQLGMSDIPFGSTSIYVSILTGSVFGEVDRFLRFFSRPSIPSAELS